MEGRENAMVLKLEGKEIMDSKRMLEKEQRNRMKAMQTNCTEIRQGRID